jgi:hypothetical protein
MRNKTGIPAIRMSGTSTAAITCLPPGSRIVPSIYSLRLEQRIVFESALSMSCKIPVSVIL